MPRSPARKSKFLPLSTSRKTTKKTTKKKPVLPAEWARARGTGRGSSADIFNRSLRVQKHILTKTIKGEEPSKKIGDLIRAAKARPGKLNADQKSALKRNWKDLASAHATLRAKLRQLMERTDAIHSVMRRQPGNSQKLAAVYRGFETLIHGVEKRIISIEDQATYFHSVLVKVFPGQEFLIGVSRANLSFVELRHFAEKHERSSYTYLRGEEPPQKVRALLAKAVQLGGPEVTRLNARLKGIEIVKEKLEKHRAQINEKIKKLQSFQTASVSANPELMNMIARLQLVGYRILNRLNALDLESNLILRRQLNNRNTAKRAGKPIK